MVMATDLALIRANVRGFYEFSEKVVLWVGAGGGQLLDPAVTPARVLAIDPDAGALQALAGRLAAWPALAARVELVALDFLTVDRPGDVVYFEFCLHEMADPLAALAHARRLAPEVVVIDHAAESPWMFMAAEDEQVRRSSAALHGQQLRRREAFDGSQRFRDHAELVAKIAGQGSLAVERARPFLAQADFAIPMPYEMALL